MAHTGRRARGALRDGELEEEKRENLFVAAGQAALEEQVGAERDR